ncbi:hypothetical protein Tco_1558456 [Tanacetum coccineum]
MSYKSNNVTALNEKIDNLSARIEELLLARQYNNNGEGTSRFSRMSKLEFPKFYRDDVQGWMFRVKQFFSIDNVPKGDKIRMVSIHIIEEPQSISMFITGLLAAIELNVRMFRPRSLSDAFSVVSLQEATLVVIKQKNTPLLPILRPTSNWNANRNTNYAPKTTTTTMALPIPNTPLLPILRPTSNWNANRNTNYAPKTTTTTMALPVLNTQIVNKYSSSETSGKKKLLSQKEFAKKRAKNLCFYCDKKYVPGHKCLL